MTPKSKPLQQGSIVIAPIVPDAGLIKPRLAIILTATDDIATQASIEVIGVTASYYPDDPVYIELPWTRDGRGPTRFAKPCAAKLTLVQRIVKEKLQSTEGYLPKPALNRLLARVKGRAAEHG